MTESATNRDDATLWTAGDVAKYLQVSRSWVYHRAEAGLLPCVRIGALLRFQPQEIRTFASGASGSAARAKVLPIAANAVRR